MLGAPISDRSDSDEDGQKPKLLVDNEGRNVLLEAEEEENELARKEEDSLRDFEEQEREIARQLAIEGTGREEEGNVEEDDGTQLMEQIHEEDEDEQEQEDDERQEDEEMDKMEGPSTGLWQMEGQQFVWIGHSFGAKNSSLERKWTAQKCCLATKSQTLSHKLQTQIPTIQQRNCQDPAKVECQNRCRIDNSLVRKFYVMSPS